MPCMILTGHPCAGKSTLAGKIRDRALNHSSKRISKVVIINETSACPDYSIDDCYATSSNEKKTRGALKSAFDRAVAANPTDSTLVLLDSSNYIKGFRYELFCISKAAACSHCVVWCLNDVAVVKEWNTKRRGETDASYSDETLDALMLRYEPPDDRNRWDKPLYRIDLRPLKEQQSEQIAGKVLEQSVYNMHSLSEAMDRPAAAAEVPDTAAEAKPAKKKSTTFKRATFKRPSRKASAVPTTIKTGELTAEALSSLEATTAAADNQAVDQSVRVVEAATARTAQSAAVDIDATKESLRLLTVEERIDAILDAFLLNVQPLQEGTSTLQHIATDSNVMHSVDSITQQVCAAIQTAQSKSATGVGRLSVAVGGSSLFLQCHRRLSPADLKSFRRHYLEWARARPPEDTSESGIAKSFLAYIEEQR